MSDIIFIILTAVACSSVFWIKLLNDIEFGEKKYFNVTWENLRYISTGKAFAEWSSLVFLIGLFNGIYNYFVKGEDTIGDIIFMLLLLLFFQGLAFIVDECKYRALPLKKVLDKKVMIESIESEEFTRIGPHCWESENWVKITYQFYPKALLLGAMVYYRHSSASGNSAIFWEAYVKTIDGKEYINEDYAGAKYKILDLLKYEITDTGGIDKINAALPLGCLTTDSKYFEIDNLKKYQDTNNLSQQVTKENTAQLLCNYEYGKQAAEAYIARLEEIEREEMTHHYRAKKK